MDRVPPSFVDYLRQRVLAVLPIEPGRIFRLDIGGRTVWIKRAVVNKHRVWHRWQRCAATLLRSPLLAMTADTAGPSALAREARIIAALRAKGAAVPDVLLAEPEWLVLGDLGPSLDAQINQAQTRETAEMLVRSGAEALARLHTMGAWHGNPLTRNIAGPADRLAFLDFEEDPARHMSVAHCQTRDVLFYVFSVGRYAKRHPALQAVALRAYLKQAKPEVVARLHGVSRMLAPVAWGLRPVRRWAGRDVRQGVDAASALAFALNVMPKPVERRSAWKRWALLIFSLGLIGFGVASLVR